MKDTFYFSHDYNARNDVKIKKLIQKQGICGYGVFWAIIEDLYNNANALPLDYESIAYELRIDIDIIKSVINDFGLFIIEGNEFGSKSVQTRLEERNERSIKARESAFKRWNNNKDDANALQPNSEGNAIKERKEKKVKESKEEESKEKTLFEKAFDDFLLMRKNIKKPPTERAIELIKDKLIKLSSGNEKIAIDILNQSTLNNWQDVFALKNDTNTKPIITPINRVVAL